MRIKEASLLEKGWTQEEIDHTKSILEKAKHNRTTKHHIHEKLRLWILLGLIIITGFTSAWLSIPFILVLHSFGALVAVSILGLGYGWLASILVADLEHLETHHHIIISIIIPITSVITSLFIYYQLQLSRAIEIYASQHNPYLLAIGFSCASLIPYIIFLVKK